MCLPIIDLNDQGKLPFSDFNELLKKLKIEDTMKTDEYNYSIAQANEKVRNLLLSFNQL